MDEKFALPSANLFVDDNVSTVRSRQSFNGVSILGNVVCGDR